MPSSPSAIKRLKQSVKRRMHNRITKKIIKTLTKRTMAAVAAKEFEKAEADFRADHGQDRQGRRPPGPPPEHRRPPQEQAGPRLHGGRGQGQGPGLIVPGPASRGDVGDHSTLPRLDESRPH